MKQCPYCGKTYSDEATVCEVDQKALVVAPPAVPPVMATAEMIDAGDKYATFWRRVGAVIVDGLVLLPVTLGYMFAMYRGMNFGTYVAISLGSFAVSIIYNVAMTARWGQTLGKMATGVKIVRLDDAPIGMKEAVMRYGVFVAVGLVITVISLLGMQNEELITTEVVTNNSKAINFVNFGWGLVQLITVLSNARRRAIHDFVAGTKVVVCKYA
jgi:uncharacterized RDD family membrane protein YckC